MKKARDFFTLPVFIVFYWSLRAAIKLFVAPLKRVTLLLCGVVRCGRTSNEHLTWTLFSWTSEGRSQPRTVIVHYHWKWMTQDKNSKSWIMLLQPSQCVMDYSELFPQVQQYYIKTTSRNSRISPQYSPLLKNNFTSHGYCVFHETKTCSPLEYTVEVLMTTLKFSLPTNHW